MNIYCISTCASKCNNGNCSQSNSIGLVSVEQLQPDIKYTHKHQRSQCKQVSYICNKIFNGIAFFRKMLYDDTLKTVRRSSWVCLRSYIESFCMFSPTQMRVCKLSLSTSALFTMTALRATSMYVKLMSNTIEVPDSGTDQRNWQAQLFLFTVQAIVCYTTLGKFYFFCVMTLWDRLVASHL